MWSEALLAFQAVTLDVEDLEADATPEDLMLSYVSGEKGKVYKSSLPFVPGKLWLHANKQSSCSTNIHCTSTAFLSELPFTVVGPCGS